MTKKKDKKDMSHVYHLHSLPQSIVSDHDRVFTSHLIWNTGTTRHGTQRWAILHSMSCMDTSPGILALLTCMLATRRPYLSGFRRNQPSPLSYRSIWLMHSFE